MCWIAVLLVWDEHVTGCTGCSIPNVAVEVGRAIPVDGSFWMVEAIGECQVECPDVTIVAGAVKFVFVMSLDGSCWTVKVVGEYPVDGPDGAVGADKVGQVGEG